MATVLIVLAHEGKGITGHADAVSKPSRSCYWQVATNLGQHVIVLTSAELPDVTDPAVAQARV